MAHHFLMVGFYNWVCSYRIDFWGVTKPGQHIHWSHESIHELSVLLLQVASQVQTYIFMNYQVKTLIALLQTWVAIKNNPTIFCWLFLLTRKFRSNICLNVSSVRHMDSRNVYDISSMDNFDNLFNLKLKVALITEMNSDWYSKKNLIERAF